MIIADNITNGYSEEFEYRFGTVEINLYIEGDFAENTVYLEAKSPSGNFVKVANGDLLPGMYTIKSYPSVYRIAISEEITGLTAYVVGQVVK